MRYKYAALSKVGGSQTDTIDADSYQEVIKQLHQKGLIPIEIKAQTGRSFYQILSNFSTVALQEKILFVENLRVMIKAGISLVKGLKILANQTKNPKLKQILEDVYHDVESGKNMSDALAKYPRVFPNIFVSMFRTGELSGTLENS